VGNFSVWVTGCWRFDLVEVFEVKLFPSSTILLRLLDFAFATSFESLTYLRCSSKSRYFLSTTGNFSVDSPCLRTSLRSRTRDFWMYVEKLIIVPQFNCSLRSKQLMLWNRNSVAINLRLRLIDITSSKSSACKTLSK
jgi:hypothetical protein